MTRRCSIFALCGGTLCLAQQPESKPGMSMAERQGRLQPGDSAPGFHLRKSKSEEKVRLSDFHGQKSVALVFGSYT